MHFGTFRSAKPGWHRPPPAWLTGSNQATDTPGRAVRKCCARHMAILGNIHSTRCFQCLKASTAVEGKEQPLIQWKFGNSVFCRGKGTERTAHIDAWTKLVHFVELSRAPVLRRMASDVLCFTPPILQFMLFIFFPASEPNTRAEGSFP